MTVFNLYVAEAPDGRFYVGCTRYGVRHRWHTHHASPPRPFPERRPSINDALKRYGRSSFVVTHVACATGLEDAGALETLLIEQYGSLTPNGYNLRARGGGGLCPRKMDRAPAPPRDLISLRRYRHVAWPPASEAA